MSTRLRLRLVPAFFIPIVLLAAFFAPLRGAHASYPMVVSAYCTNVTLVAAPPSGQFSGTPIVFTATPTCPNPNPLFEFWMRAASQPDWVMIQGYSTNNKYNWNSTGAAPGIVFFGVWVKDATSGTSTFDANASIPFTVNPPCGTATISPASASVTEGSGAHDLLTGAATCANASPLFEFWMRTATTDWVIIKSYSTSATYDWNSTGAPPGIVYFGLWVKDAKSGTATFDSNASTTVTVTPAKCTTLATPTAVPNTVAHSTSGGMHVTITGAATGCTNSPLYEFWLRTATSDWILVQAYTALATYDWNSTGAPVGTIYFGVWAKDTKSSTSTFDVNASTTVAVT